MKNKSLKLISIFLYISHEIYTKIHIHTLMIHHREKKISMTHILNEITEISY